MVQDSGQVQDSGEIYTNNIHLDHIVGKNPYIIAKNHRKYLETLYEKCDTYKGEQNTKWCKSWIIERCTIVLEIWAEYYNLESTPSCNPNKNTNGFYKNEIIWILFED